MEIKNITAQKEINDMSSTKKVQPVAKSFFKEKYAHYVVSICK